MTLDTYGHLFDGQDEALAERLADLMSDAPFSAPSGGNA